LNKNNFDSDEKNSPEYIKLKNKKDINGQNLSIQLEENIFGKSSISQSQQISKDEELIPQNQQIIESEFLCPECHKLEPEILNINISNKTIDFLCKICGENNYKFKNFYKKIENDDMICYYFKPKIVDVQENKFWLKEYKNQNHSLTDSKNSLMEQISNRDLKVYKEIIKQKNEQLKKIIKFNEVIISNIKNYQNNYFYLKNLKNICK